MIRFGVIGTSNISREFIRCAILEEDCCLNAFYSRSKEKAQAFADEYSVNNTFTNLNNMAQSKVIDAVYIASPNSFHASQAIQFMKNNKHVLCEKPIASNSRELREMITTAKQNNVVFMEAMKTTLLPNFKAIKDNLHKIGEIRRYFASYCKYSSRYDAYKSGKNPNTFNPQFSNGSLMDIGVYCIYPAIALFGKPNSISAQALILDSGVDGMGNLHLKYDTKDALIIHSKITDSYAASEIQGEKGTIVIDKIHTPEKIEILYRNGEVENITKPQIKDVMRYEIKEFINLIKDGKLESNVNSHRLSADVMHVMETARKQFGLIYPADIR